MKKITEYKHIIWDWNGTLLDDVSICVDVTNQLLEERNKKTMTIDYYKEIFDFPVSEYYERAGFSFSEEPFEIVGTLFIKEYERNLVKCKLQKDAIDILETIYNKNIPQSILSAASQSMLVDAVRFYNIEKYFVKLIGLDDHFAHGKVENGKRWIKEIGINKKDVLLIGDTTHDYLVSKELDIDCVLVSHGHHKEDKLLQVHDNVVKSLRELIV